MISNTDLILLGWDKIRDMPLHGMEFKRRGYVVKLWPKRFQIYREGLPCCLFDTSHYTREDMIHMMHALKMMPDDRD